VKNLFILFAFIKPFAATFAQANLPASWDFNGAAPAGWTISGTSTYASNGYSNTIPSCKLDGTGDYVELYFTGNPGMLSYYLKGASFSGGTFSVQESINAISWSTVREISMPDNSTVTKYSDNINIDSRYIRFYYTNKVAGNIALDDVSLAAEQVLPGPKINVKQGTKNIFNGSTIVINAPVNSSISIPLRLENRGTTNALTINAISVTGTDQNDFTVSPIAPFTINALDSVQFKINFTPSQAGTRTATINIESNDVDQSSYKINVYGIGGLYATEPSAQPDNIAFSNVKSYRFSVLFRNAFPQPDGYLVLRKTASSIKDLPTDGKIYTRGDTIGESQVAYSGKDTAFIPSAIVANTDYYFAVFAYNGFGQYINYLQTAPLQAKVSSAGSMQGNYYEGISSSNSDFVTVLHNKINPHTQISYGDYAATMIDKFVCRDTTNGKKAITCVYSGDNYVYDDPFDWSVYSREHTFPFSWMPTHPSNKGPEYSDQHNLFPAHLQKANTPRSNYPFGIVKIPVFQYLEGKLGLDSKGSMVYEPRDVHKGNAARAMLYMTVCYDGVDGKRWFLPPQQNEDLLKLWHWQDPPDNWEIARNDFIDSLQGNRNPFIDSVQFVCYIDFHTLTKIENAASPCIPLGINESTFASDNIKIFPNPSNSNCTLLFSADRAQEVLLKMRDVTGRILYTRTIKANAGLNKISLETETFQKGFYLLEYCRDNKKSTEKLLIE